MQTLIVGASQVVSMAGPSRPRIGDEMRALGLIENGALLIEDGIVLAAGRSDELRRIASADCREVDVQGRVVTPGLVDAHTHPVFGGSRLDDFERRIQGLSYAEIGKLGGGIRSTVRATQTSEDDELVLAGAKRVERMLAAGTTAIEAKSGYGGSLTTELSLLRVLQKLSALGKMKIVPTLLGAHAVPDGHTSASFAKIVAEEMIPVATAEGLAQYVDVFVEDGYYSHDDARLIASAAKQHGLGIRLHVDQLHVGGGAELAAELGATTADHLEYVSDTGIEALRAQGVIPVLLPGSVYCLGSQTYPPARKMIEACLPVVIATDFNPGSSPVMSLMATMNMACTQMRMLPSEALASCTINAAYSIGLGSQIGSLEKGKSADFVVWNASDYRELAYWVGRNLVHQVWVNGKLVVKGMEAEV